MLQKAKKIINNLAQKAVEERILQDYDLDLSGELLFSIGDDLTWDWIFDVIKENVALLKSGEIDESDCFTLTSENIANCYFENEIESKINDLAEYFFYSYEKPTRADYIANFFCN